MLQLKKGVGLTVLEYGQVRKARRAVCRLRRCSVFGISLAMSALFKTLVQLQS
jgi:hypothetical protein